MRKPEKRSLRSRIEEGAMAAGALILAGGLLAAFLLVSAWCLGAWGTRRPAEAPDAAALRPR